MSYGTIGTQEDGELYHQEDEVQDILIFIISETTYQENIKGTV
jgi:hypothetical protein